jgi:arylsulfatase A-like enzyme
MTGTYPSTHGVWDCTHTQRPEWVDLRGDLAHWSQRLAEAGYVNGYFGKWHVEQTNRLGDFGWHEHEEHCSSARAQPAKGTEIIVENEGYRPYLLAAVAEGSGPLTHPAYDRSIEFIRRHAGGGRPFCCCVSTSEPHDAYVPARRFMDMYDVESVRPSPTLRERDGGKPEVVARMRAVWEGLSDADWRYVSAAYWAVVTFLDSETGRISQALKDAGCYGETIIVATSDHGDMLGGHGLATKGVGTPYEEVYNVPLIVRVPGMRSGEDTEHRVSLVDVGPTLLDLCGARPLDACQGRSLRPVLVYGQRFVYTQRIVWHGDWKYVFSPGGRDELYNLDQDPHERTNLATDPTHRGTLMEMCKRMWRKMEEIGDESLFRTHYATLRTAPVGPHSIREKRAD